MDIESKIIDKFNEIKKLGFVKNNRPGNDGGVGNTFEDYLEVDENNQTEADFENFEVKSKRQFTKSYMSLYTKKPTHPENGDSYMRETFGVYDEEYPDIKVLRTSIYAHRWSLVYKKLNIEKLKLLFLNLFIQIFQFLNISFKSESSMKSIFFSIISELQVSLTTSNCFVRIGLTP